MKDHSRILVRPILTEKSTLLQEDANTFVFEVALDSNKIQIAEAVQSLFGVKVSGVRTLVQRGKVRRFGRHIGKRSNWKKAYVTVAEGEEIDLLAAV